MDYKETARAVDSPGYIIFGGTFNPVHEGHMGLMRGLLEREQGSCLLAVPASRNPFKGSGRLLPPGLRLEMLRSAMREMERASVLDLELRRPDPSYTIDTVTALGASYPGAVLRLAMGWDVYSQFPGWRDSGEIIERAGLLVIPRAGLNSPPPARGGEWLKGLPAQWRARARLDGKGRIVDGGGRVLVEFIELELPDISSSNILAERNPEQVPEGARELLTAYWEENDR